MRTFFVKQQSDDAVYKINANFSPTQYERVRPVSESLQNEDTRWLQWEQIEVTLPSGDPELQWQVTINQQLKDATILADAEAQSARAVAKAKQAARDIKKKRFAFGLELKAEISVLNDTKNWTLEQFQAFASDPRIQKLSLLLNDGAIETALAFTNTLDLSVYYTTEELNGIKQMMQDFINENPT